MLLLLLINYPYLFAFFFNFFFIYFRTFIYLNETIVVILFVLNSFSSFFLFLSITCRFFYIQTDLHLWKPLFINQQMPFILHTVKISFSLSKGEYYILCTQKNKYYPCNCFTNRNKDRSEGFVMNRNSITKNEKTGLR